MVGTDDTQSGVQVNKLPPVNSAFSFDNEHMEFGNAPKIQSNN